MSSSSQETTESSILEHLRKIMIQKQTPNNSNDIPIFHIKKPSPDSLKSRVQSMAKLRFLQKQNDDLLDQKELEFLWICLRENRTLPDEESGTEKICYDDFKRVGRICEEKIGKKSEKFFSPISFLTFEADFKNRISILPFYLYCMRWVSITQTRIEMCLLDSDGDGYLNPEEMEEFIRQCIPNLYLLRGIDSSFLSIYCQIAVRKFLFFCDPYKKGKLLIREVLLSPVLSELMELRQNEGEDQLGTFQDNWFSLPYALRIYHTFLSLDVDGNGTLCKRELKSFKDECLTDIFIERVFDEHVKRGKGERGNKREMNLSSFLDLVLALENKHMVEGLTYLFKCLDLEGKGYLTISDVYMLFKDIHTRWKEGGNYDLMIADVKDEIWDMVRPKDPFKLTLEDLVDCKQGDTVCSMLIDISGFWTHDNRDSLAAQQDYED